MEKKEKEFETRNSYKYYVKKNKWKDFEKMCEANSKDPYCIVCILCVHQVLRYLEWGWFLKPLKKMPKLTPKQAMDKGLESIKGYGISVSQANFIVQDVIRFSKTRGKEFKKWWNKKHGGTGKEKGVVISNMFAINIEDKLKGGRNSSQP